MHNIKDRKSKPVIVEEEKENLDEFVEMVGENENEVHHTKSLLLEEIETYFG